MYPTNDTPYYGIFVKEQIDIMRKYHDVDLDVFFIDGRIDKLQYLKTISKIKTRINNGSYDLIHVHYGFSGLFLLSVRKFAIPVIVTLHGGDIQIEQGKKCQVYFTKKILRKTNTAIVLNEEMNDIVKRYVKNIFCIPCSVNTELFHEGVNKNNSIKHIVFPSDKNRKIKNYPLFSKTIEILRLKYKVNCNTYEVSNMSREQVSNLFQHSDILLMTSISEGSPQVVKEALACNLPVVTTAVGDVRTLLDGVKGCAVANNHDAEELAELVFKSLNNKIDGSLTPREKIFKLGLDDKSISNQIYKVYQKTIDEFLI